MGATPSWDDTLCDPQIAIVGLRVPCLCYLSVFKVPRDMEYLFPMREFSFLKRKRTLSTLCKNTKEMRLRVFFMMPWYHYSGREDQCISAKT